MTAVNDRATRSRPPSLQLLLAVVGATVAVPVLIVTLLLLPWWAALVAAAAVTAAVILWSWRASISTVRTLGRGVPADPQQHARLLNVVDGLCLAAGVTRPLVEVVDDPAANALVAGLNQRDSLLLVTSGLLEVLDRVELEAVVAHQLVQIRDPGLAAATLSVTTVSLPILLADRLIRRSWWNGGRAPRDGDRASAASGGIGVGLLGFATAISPMRRLGVGDDRQAWADLEAVRLTRYPPGLIDAYEACIARGTVVHAGCRATAHLWLARPIATEAGEGELIERNRGFVESRELDERVAVLREL